MKLHHKNLLLMLGIISLCTIVGFVSTFIWGSGNKVEVIAEDIVELETGVKPNFDLIKRKFK